MPKRQYPPDPKIAERLAVILEYHEISQTELARRLNLTPAAVNHWIGGKGAISDKNAHKIGEALGEDPDFILCRKDSGAMGMGRVVGQLMGLIGGKRLKALQEIDPLRMLESLDRLIEEHGAEKPE